MKKLMFFWVCIALLTLAVAEVEEFGYSNPELPILGTGGGNVSLQTVNNSIFWGGYPFDLNRWLLIDGSNANQNININPYNITAGYLIGDGSGLTNLPNVYPHDQNLNTTDSPQFVDLNLTNNLTAVNGTFQYLNVTKDLFVSNSTLYIGNVSISSNTAGTDNILNISADEVRATYFVGDGSRLTNISFENGTVIAAAINASDYYGGNFFGDFFGTYDWTAETPWLLFNGTYLSFNDTKLSNEYVSTTGYTFINGTLNVTQIYAENLDVINLTARQIHAINITADTIDVINMSVEDLTAATIFVRNFTTNGTPEGFCLSDGTGCNTSYTNITIGNITITDWSAVNYTTSNDTVVFGTPSFTGSYSTVLPEIFSYEITQLIVTPTDLTGNYRFSVYEAGSGETIEADIIKHKGQWNIMKSYTLDNQITLNFTNVNPSNSFNITIKYLKNSPN